MPSDTAGPLRFRAGGWESRASPSIIHACLRLPAGTGPTGPSSARKDKVPTPGSAASELRLAFPRAHKGLLLPGPGGSRTSSSCKEDKPSAGLLPVRFTAFPRGHLSPPVTARGSGDTCLPSEGPRGGEASAPTCHASRFLLELRKLRQAQPTQLMDGFGGASCPEPCLPAHPSPSHFMVHRSRGNQKQKTKNAKCKATKGSARRSACGPRSPLPSSSTRSRQAGLRSER